MTDLVWVTQSKKVGLGIRKHMRIDSSYMKGKEVLKQRWFLMIKALHTWLLNITIKIKSFAFLGQIVQTQTTMHFASLNGLAFDNFSLPIPEKLKWELPYLIQILLILGGKYTPPEAYWVPPNPLTFGGWILYPRMLGGRFVRPLNKLFGGWVFSYFHGLTNELEGSWHY